MKKPLIATTNPGKVQEFSKFLSVLQLELFSLRDLGITTVFEETGQTYKENSQGKAIFYSKLSGLPAIADDGGIEIGALGGEPGVKSARWLGPNTTEDDIINHMIKVARELPESNRDCSFKTVVSLATPDGNVWSTDGFIHGLIAKDPLQEHLKGYPYRSFFYLPKLKKFYHEKDLTEEEEKLYNHRYKAVKKLLPSIKKILNI